jgi:energy-coupling factor transporter ATP-binding protein EcfA2
MPAAMHTLEVAVARKIDDGWPVVVWSRAPSFLTVRDEGLLKLDLDELRQLELDAKAYGIRLGEALFDDVRIRDVFVQSLTKSGNALRILLSIEDLTLRSLRWERLCAPLDGSWGHLALDQRLRFSLSLPSRIDQRFLPIGRRELRALVLVASPDGLEHYGLSHFDVDSVVTDVRLALEDVPSVLLAATTGAAGPPTLEALCQQITANRYPILHIACHGRYAGDGRDTVLFLAGSDRGIDPVTGKRFVDRLRGLRGAAGLPNFVFLETCQSAAPEAEGALGGLAQQLVRDLGMPAVLAMTDRVSVATARAFTTGFYTRLRSHGAIDQAVVEASSALADSGDLTVPVLISRLGDQPLFTDVLDRDPTAAEVAKGLDRLAELLDERAPILRPDFDAQAEIVRKALQAARSPADAAAEERRALDRLDALCGEILNLTFRALALGHEPGSYDGRCPFVGLYPFRFEEQEFFFGREDLVERLRRRLEAHRFLAVLGNSGSGKSSLVLAGLLPALGASIQAVAYLTPGSHPSDQLAASLASVGGRPELLVVDQLEELFTLCLDEGERQDFVHRLLELAGTLRVVLTMRADFWGECAAYRELSDLMKARQELIGPMDGRELRRSMEQQANRVGLRFEADLAARILDDVSSEPGAMPLLQHALRELWRRRHGSWLSADEYRELGGVNLAISRTADSVYKTLPANDQDQVRDIFVRLTRLDEDSVQAEDRRDTRRRVGLAELVPAGSDQEATKRLVARLASARLLVTGRNAATGEEEVEVAHEALIRYWPMLERWLKEDWADLRIREGVRRAALEWRQSGQDDSYLLHRGARLDDALRLVSHPRLRLNDAERRYLEACEEADDRYRRWDVEAELRSLMTPSDPVDDTLALEISVRRRRASEDDDLRRLRPDVVRFTIDRHALAAVAADATAYGQLLGASFFASDPAEEISNQAERILGEALGEARARGRSLRLQLRTDPAAPELSGLYWETLRHPRDDAPLLTKHGVTFARLVDSQRARLRPKSDPQALTVQAVAVGNEDAGPPHASVAGASSAYSSSNRVTLDALGGHVNGGYEVVLVTCKVTWERGELWLQDQGVERLSASALLSQLTSFSQPPRLLILDVRSGDSPGLQAMVRSELAVLAQELVTRAGLPALIVMPTTMSAQARHEFLTTLLQQLGHEEQVDKAVAAAWQASDDRPASWPCMLFTSFTSGHLWYVPGFVPRPGERAASDLWRLLVSQIDAGRCTPVLGPGTVSTFFESRTDIARRWSDRFGLSYTPDSINLPSIAQQLAVRYGARFPGSKLEEDARSRLLERLEHSMLVDRDVLDELRDAPTTRVLGVAWTRLAGNDSNDATRLLAALPFPVYVTINPDDLLVFALEAAGKRPTVEVLRQQMEGTQPANDEWSIGDDFDDRYPSPERPLVFQIFGSLDDPDSIALTEDDTFEFLLSMTRWHDILPSVVARALASTTLLLLGFEADDRYGQTLWRSVQGLRGARRRRSVHVIQMEPEENSGVARRGRRPWWESELSRYRGSVIEFLQQLMWELKRAPDEARL